MFVAQPCTQLSDGRHPRILRKEAAIPLVDGHVRRSHDTFRIAVHVSAVRADILATDRHFAAKDRVRQNELRRNEAVTHTILRVYDAVFLHAAHLLGVRARRVAARVEVGIEVNPQAAHLPIIVSVDSVRRIRRFAPLPAVLPFVVKSIVGVNDTVENRMPRP